MNGNQVTGVVLLVPEIRIIDLVANFLVNFDVRRSEIDVDTLFTSQIMLITNSEGSRSLKKILGMKVIPRVAQTEVLEFGLTQVEPTLIVEGSGCLGRPTKSQRLALSKQWLCMMGSGWTKVGINQSHCSRFFLM